MKNNLKITALATLLLFAAASVANAQYRRVNNRMSYPGQCYDIPGLTDTQKEKITAINDAHQKAIDQMRKDFWSAKDVISANKIKADMTLEQNSHLNKISGLLNEEQLKYFNENIIAVPSGRGRAISRQGRGGRGYGFAQGAPGMARNRIARGPAGRGRGAGFGRW
jgi:hypothetical protein